MASSSISSLARVNPPSPLSRSWSGGMVRWSWGSAASCSAIRTPPRMPSRPRSWCWRAGRLDPRSRSARSLALRRGLPHARKARTLARRRYRHEIQEEDVALARIGNEEVRHEQGLSRREQAQMLHEELNRLPERYRVPVVLCDIEGLTHLEAASRLRCPPGTLSVRLMRARQLLRVRLTRRGLTSALALVAIDGLSETASATVPAPWPRPPSGPRLISRPATRSPSAPFRNRYPRWRPPS